MQNLFKFKLKFNMKDKRYPTQFQIFFDFRIFLIFFKTFLDFWEHFGFSETNRIFRKFLDFWTQ